MTPINLIPKPRVEAGHVSHAYTILVSCALHGAAFGLLLGGIYLYRAHTPPVHNGSAPGATTITLSTLVIMPRPQVTPPIQTSVAPTPSVAVLVRTWPPPQQEPEVKPEPADTSVSALVMEAAKQEPIKQAEISVAMPPAKLHLPATKPESKPVPAAVTSSFAPGVSIFPHPPYPSEASDLQQTGTVIMSVQFDAQGAVASVDVAKSSGVRLLDSSTRTYIRSHWRSTAYAGQTVWVPVKYSLENL